MNTIEGIELRDNVPIWAYSCRKFGSRYSTIRPYFGVLRGSSFYPIGKDGKLKSTGSVYCDQRTYSISEENAIRNFNEGIDKIISIYEKELDRYKKIKV